MRITNKQCKAMQDLLHQQAVLENETGVNTIQSNRFFRDSVIGKMIDKDIYMNTENHGWDGVLKNGTMFENKNIKAGCKSRSSFSLEFQDTSLDKLTEMDNGVFVVNSFWSKDNTPAFLMIGNTRDVSHFLNASYNPAHRKTSTVSMINCIKNGFKIVAIDYSKKAVWDIISSKFPTLGTVMTMNDIYTKKDLPKLVSEMS